MVGRRINSRGKSLHINLWLLLLGVGLCGQHALASPAVGPLCEVSGSAGNIIECPIELISEGIDHPQATSLQFGLSMPALVELNQITDGEYCIGFVCLPYTLPTPNSVLQSGHTLSLSPTALFQWKDEDTGASEGDILLIHSTSPDTPLTNAYYTSDGIEGNPVLLTLQITLLEDIPPEAPAQVILEWIMASGGTGQPLETSLSPPDGDESAHFLTKTIDLLCSENGVVCDDGDACTVNDSCIVGFCYGQPIDCDDDNPCTSEDCDAVDGCSIAPKGGSCDDDDPCTVDDTCGGGICIPGSALECDDGVPCTLNKCVLGVGCNFDVALDCDDDNVCTTEICDEEAGCVTTSDISNDCEDPNPCTLDICDPVEGCIHPPQVDGGPCDDGNGCTLNEICTEGVCSSELTLECEDGNPCTTDYCNPVSGCVTFPNNNACDDGNACTLVDECDEQVCVGVGELDCDDDNPCTEEVCVPATGCKSINADGVSCNDGLTCNDEVSPDVCQGGNCIGAQCDCDKDSDCLDDGDKCNGTPLCHPFLKICVNGDPINCEDAGGPCTSPVCDSVLGICTYINEPNNSPCTDGSLCTSGGSCWMGDCLTNLVGCNDGNYCTADSCSFEDGSCIFEVLPSDTACTDGNTCTGKDTCVQGLCTGLANTNCNDGNPCTTDSCVSETGCTYEYNTVFCEDGDLCTSKDLCEDGECQSGIPTDCDDDNLCTVDICKSDEGCLHPELDCNDDTLCNGQESCHPIYGCQSGTPPLCVDDDPCTEEGCDAEDGCVFYDICGPGPYTAAYSPTAVEGGVDRTLTFTGWGYSPQTEVVVEGAIFVEDSDFDEDELVLMEFISKTEIKARFIGPLAEGLYDITVIDGLWSQKFVNGLEVLNPPKAPLGGITFLDPISNEKFGSPQGDAVDIPVLVDVTDLEVGPGKTHIAWYLDGIQKGFTAVPEYTFEDVTPGRRHLTAELVDSEGNPTVAETWKATIPIKIVTPCAVASDCYESVCSNYACASECKYGPTSPTCCINDTMCGPGSVCVDGTCTDCETDSDCVEGDTCTVDRCVEGICVHEEIPDCCEVAGDCDDDNPCTIDFCIQALGTCDVEIDTVEGCCTSSVDCADESPCTLDFCIANKCRYGPHPTFSSCCNEDSDCVNGAICVEGECIECSADFNPSCDDGDVCTVTTCNFATKKCLIEEVPNCCENNGDCDDENSCTSNTCNQTFMTCFFGDPDEDCCDIDDHCNDDVPCNVDKCISGTCRFGPDPVFPDCCEPGALGLSYLNCTDNNPCTQDICNPQTFTCSIQDPPGQQCCSTPEECDDGDPATLNQCIEGACTFPIDPNYCENVLDCDDEDPCTTATCVDEQCVFTNVPGCCTSNFNCNDGDPCTDDLCDLDFGLCSYETVGNCCDTVADCPAPGPCQQVACIGIACRYAKVNNCCVADSECEDNNPCSDDLCVDNQCAYSAAPGCSCQKDADCDDGDVCTQEACGNDGFCIVSEADSCCSSHGDCDDNNECTTDICLGGTCKQLATQGCCASDAECSDFDSCTEDSCIDNECVHVDLDICVEPMGTLHEFTLTLEDEGFYEDTNPKDLPGWKVTDGKASLILSTGPPVAWQSTLYSPLIDATGSEVLYLQWDQFIPSAAGTPGDELEVRMSTDEGASWTVIYAHNPAGPSAQERISVDISALAAGQSSIQLAFAWSAQPSSGGSHWTVDNVVIGQNYPPVFTSQDELIQLIPVSKATKVPVMALDTDPGAVVSLSMLGAPDFAVLQSDLAIGPEFAAQIIFTPTQVDTGAYTVQLKALDENNLSAVLTYTFQVQ